MNDRQDGEVVRGGRGNGRPFQCAAVPWIACGIPVHIAFTNTSYQLLHLDENTQLTNPASVRSELVRVVYEVEKAARAVEASPLPNEYADMLRRAY